MNLLTYIGTYGDEALIGIELDSRSKTIQVSRTQIKKNQLLIEENHSFNDVLQLHAFLSRWPTLPILALIKGENTVEQWVPTQSEDILKEILGVRVENPKDFIYEIIDVQGPEKLINLIRRDQLEGTLQVLKNYRKRLITVHLSEASLALLIPSMVDYQGDVCYELRLEERAYHWRNGFIKSKNSVKIITKEALALSLELPQESLHLYASAFAYYGRNTHSVVGEKQLLNNRKKVQQFGKYTKVLAGGTAAMAGSMLILFLVNLGLNTFISNAESKITTNKSVLVQLDEQEKELNAQQYFLKTQGTSSFQPTRIAWLVDQLAINAPENLAFKQILLHPEGKRLKKMDPDWKEEIPDLLVIGQSLQAQTLTKFALEIQKMLWVESAEIYTSEFDYRTQKHEFTLLIQLSNG